MNVASFVARSVDGPVPWSRTVHWFAKRVGRLVGCLSIGKWVYSSFEERGCFSWECMQCCSRTPSAPVGSYTK